MFAFYYLPSLDLPTDRGKGKELVLEQKASASGAPLGITSVRGLEEFLKRDDFQYVLAVYFVENAPAAGLLQKVHSIYLARSIAGTYKTSQYLFRCIL